MGLNPSSASEHVFLSCEKVCIPIKNMRLTLVSSMDHRETVMWG